MRKALSLKTSTDITTAGVHARWQEPNWRSGGGGGSSGGTSNSGGACSKFSFPESQTVGMEPQFDEEENLRPLQHHQNSDVVINFGNGDCHRGCVGVAVGGGGDGPECQDSSEDGTSDVISQQIPAEVWKTALAFGFMVCGMSLTAFSLIFVHERVPESPPLPDVLLSRVTHVPWALDVCEYLLLVTLAATYITAFLHRHRWIILRRIFFTVGMLFAYRAVTIFVTALPNPNPTYYCEPKLNQSLSITVVLSRLLRLAKGGGFSINGNHVYCGDYIFSGHTSILTLGYLVIKEYTSRRLSILHWTSWVVSLTGVVFLVLSHGHYTIDIILGYWVTTRLWWMYHTAANFPGQRTHGYFRGAIWWRAFAFFEANVRCGPLPYEFDLPWPDWLRAGICGAGGPSEPTCGNLLAQRLSQCRHRTLEWCRRLRTQYT